MVGNKSAKRPEDLSSEEKNRIIAALYVRRLINMGNKSIQEILDSLQEDILDYLDKGRGRCTDGDVLLEGIWRFEQEFSNFNNKTICTWAETYLQYMLSEHGKVATNIERKGYDLGDRIAYYADFDIRDLKKDRPIVEQLNPNNPIYTQAVKKVDLSPEGQKRKRRSVDTVLAAYDMMEPEEWNEERRKTEDAFMKSVASKINKNEPIQKPNGRGLLYMLKAAQNLTIPGGRDYLEEIISRQEVHEALAEFMESELAKRVRRESESNKSAGKVDGKGSLIGRKLTKGEQEHNGAVEFLKSIPKEQIPGFISKLNESTFKSPLKVEAKLENMPRAQFYCLIARMYGKIPTSTKNGQYFEFDFNQDGAR